MVFLQLTVVLPVPPLTDEGFIDCVEIVTQVVKLFSASLLLLNRAQSSQRTVKITDIMFNKGINKKPRWYFPQAPRSCVDLCVHRPTQMFDSMWWMDAVTTHVVISELCLLCFIHILTKSDLKIKSVTFKAAESEAEHTGDGLSSRGSKNTWIRNGTVSMYQKLYPDY